MDSLELLPGMRSVTKLDAEISEQKQNWSTKKGSSETLLLAGIGNPKLSAWVW